MGGKSHYFQKENSEKSPFIIQLLIINSQERFLLSLTLCFCTPQSITGHF